MSTANPAIRMVRTQGPALQERLTNRPVSNLKRGKYDEDLTLHWHPAEQIFHEKDFGNMEQEVCVPAHRKGTSWRRQSQCAGGDPTQEEGGERSNISGAKSSEYPRMMKLMLRSAVTNIRPKELFVQEKQTSEILTSPLLSERKDCEDWPAYLAVEERVEAWGRHREIFNRKGTSQDAFVLDDMVARKRQPESCLFFFFDSSARETQREDVHR